MLQPFIDNLHKAIIKPIISNKRGDYDMFNLKIFAGELDFIYELCIETDLIYRQTHLNESEFDIIDAEIKIHDCTLSDSNNDEVDYELYVGELDELKKSLINYLKIY